ncbi:hypothetical protein MP638_005436 [Amoeboaphelidium occidentale]|nr:hypothetical protein MP638_005436 [Amoeboaphelidium occidentale]
MASSGIKKIVPLLDRVLVRRVKAAEKTASGILIPEKAQGQQQEGVIMAAGPGAFHPQTGGRVPLGLKVGDSVLLPQYGGNAVKLNGEELLLYKESEILAVLEK